MDIVYADNNATTRVAPEVRDAMLPYLDGRYGNPSSLHRLGTEVAKDLKNARKQVAGLIGAKPKEIVFTSCGTESNNTAIFGTLAAHPKRRHFVSTSVEHSAVLNCQQHLERHGYSVTWVGVSANGRLDENALFKAIRPDTCLVSVMWANNETGVINPVPELARKVKSKFPEVLFHTDAVQAIGKIPVDVTKAPVDLLTLSGHKFHAAKGVGALMIRSGVRLTARMIGGLQEEGYRAGTENVASIVGLGVACELAGKGLKHMNVGVRRMRDRMEKGLAGAIPALRVNGAGLSRVPGTSNLSFRGLESDAILTALDGEGICASAGSACKSGRSEPSHVLTAMGLPKEWALGTVRVSLGRYNQEADVDRIIEVLPKVISKLSGIASPVA